MKVDKYSRAQAGARVHIPYLELVAITAAVMALNALAVDMMLPALGVISDELGAAHPNDRQLVIVVYVVGNGLAQLLFGPLVDRFGRRRVLLGALAGYVAGSLLSVVAPTYALLLAARGFQGVATAAARVSSMAIVRDQCSGRKMAEVMSLAVTIFMAAPILAPSFGQLVLLAAPWRWIFLVLLIYAAILAVWFYLRLPETLPKSMHVRLSPGPVIAAYGDFARTRVTIGYTLASAFMFGGLFGYISASEQIFVETFHLGARFPIAFAAVAASFAVASLFNARLVGRFGMRRLSHTALILFVLMNITHLAVAAAMGDHLFIFLGFMSVSFFSLGLFGPNASALAMEPMGHIAGSAAAAYGFATTTIAGIFGALVGRLYDGATTPIIAGFVGLGLAAFLIVMITERGILFHPGHPEEDAKT